MTGKPSVKFSVLIVSYKSSAHLSRCLDAILKQTLSPETYEVIVVDNASDDFDPVALRTAYPSVRFEPYEDNLGFAVANNRAAALASGAWLVLVNPDAFAHDDFLQRLDQAIWTFPGVCLFTAQQLSAAHPGKLDGAGDAMAWFGFPFRMGYGHDVPKRLRASEVFSPCGAAMMIGRDLFSRLGGFDESLYIYCEDADLGYRARLMGEMCVLAPAAKVDHIGSAILGARSDFALYYGYRNRFRLYLKNTPAGLLILSILPHLIFTAALACKDILAGKGAIIARAFVDTLKNFSLIMSQRRKVQSTRRLKTLRLIKVLTWNPRIIATRGLDLKEIENDTV